MLHCTGSEYKYHSFQHTLANIPYNIFKGGKKYVWFVLHKIIFLIRQKLTEAKMLVLKIVKV